MFLASILFHVALLAALAHDATPARAAEAAPAAAEASGKAAPATAGKEQPAEEKPAVTRHKVVVNGRPLAYTATAGTLPIVAVSGETEARMFFVAYTADNAGNAGERPLLFAFNGGPGSSSVWLHLGAIGPRRVQLPEDGSMPPPPYRLTDNAETWLDQADLVFVDPVGTGYSRAAKPDQASKFFSLKGDIESVGEFVRLYLTRYRRWSSPLFLAGESYGSMRAAGLADYLLDHGIACNGVIFVSTVLNFGTIGFTPGNDLPYALFLPSYTATAWFHRKLPPEMEHDLPALLAEVETWAMTDYLTALGKGDRLTPGERQGIVRRLARYTGLDERFIETSNLRVEDARFRAELLRGEKRRVGRFDGRLSGSDLFAAAEHPDVDPSLAAVRPPFTAALNEYVRGELGYASDLEYFILGGGVGHWDWGANNSFADTSAALSSAFGKNPYLRLFVASGTFDLATPYLSSEYTLSHLGLDPAMRQNVTTVRYPAGHMMYTDARSRAKLKRDVTDFIRAAASPRPFSPSAR